MKNNRLEQLQYLNHKSNGFSLLEVIITLCITLLLLQFTYPSYHRYLAKSRRHEGQLALIDLANRMEQHYAAYHSYQQATLGSGKPTDLKENNLSLKGWYHLSIRLQTATTYTLEAQAIKTQALADDPSCQILTLNEHGTKGTANHCWQ